MSSSNYLFGLAKEQFAGTPSSKTQLKSQRKLRSGKQARRARGLKIFLSFGLVNARSVCCKPRVITDHIISNKKDIIAITETWLKPEHGDEVMLNLCPAGYAAVQTPRMDGRRGGGVGLLYRVSIRNENSFPISHVQSTFEFQATSLSVNST